MRKNNWLKRLELAIKFVRYGSGKCRIMSCGKCGSIAIRSITKKPIETQCINDKRHIDMVFADFNECLHCGAVCYEVQQWNFEGDVEKIGTGVIASVKKL